jgi:hypothetical protein
MGGVNQSAGGCQCPATGISFTHNVTGCAGLALPGATVGWWNNSGKSISYGGGTTDASGNVTVTVPGAASYYREVTYSPRFTLKSGNVTVTGPGVTITDAMTSNIDPSYICVNCCVLPFAQVMTFTSAQYGTWTGNWATALTAGFSGPGCGPCPSGAIITPGFVSGSSCPILVSVWVNLITGCPTTYGQPNYGACGFISYTKTALTCPPSLSWTGTSTFSTNPGGCFDKISGCGTYPWTDTITAHE